jgi:diadenosine tetraphosphate (Ap4A) HIT family hydrolase
MTAECSCQFCLEFLGDDAAIYNSLAKSYLPDRSIYRNEHFRIIPPLGQFVEGAVMIVSERHIPSCAMLYENEYESLESLLLLTETILRREFSSPIFFEHGPPIAGKGTCCVDHAHIHAFPVKVDVHEFLKKRFPWVKITTLRELSSYSNDNGAYLFLQQQGRRYFYQCDVIPSQLIRQIIASELGIPERWNWKDYLGLSEMRFTWERLHNINWNSK